MPHINIVTVKPQHLARHQTVNLLPLSAVFTQGDADVRSQSDQEDTLILT